MKKGANKKSHIKMSFFLRMSFAFLIGFLITSFIAAVVVLIAWKAGYSFSYFSPWLIVLSSMMSSSVLGFLAAYFINKSWVAQVDELKVILNDISKGDFSKRLPLPDEDSIFFDAFYSFNKMVDELNSNAILKKDFISNFSHEFKTPIVSIKGYAELLNEEDNLTYEERKKYLNIIIEESARLSKLSNQTMLMCKLDSKAILEDCEIYDLNSQLDECILLLDNFLKEKNLYVELNTYSLNVYANKSLFKELWINLITNAIKYSNNNGKINISMYQSEKELSIAITDNGIGMDENSIAHIFDKYYQADQSHHVKGIGLGLSISKRIVELSNGRIDVSSKKNKGSTFNVVFPLSIIKNEMDE